MGDIQHSAVEEGKGTEEEEEALAMKAAAFYDLGLNYLLRARMACSDAGEGSGLFSQEVYEELPEVAELARSAVNTYACPNPPSGNRYRTPWTSRFSKLHGFQYSTPPKRL